MCVYGLGLTFHVNVTVFKMFLVIGQSKWPIIKKIKIYELV
jgi:hypothetical protein